MPTLKRSARLFAIVAAAVLIAPFGAKADTVDVTLTGVPEPSSLLLLGAGMLGVALFLRWMMAGETGADGTQK